MARILGIVSPNADTTRIKRIKHFSTYKLAKTGNERFKILVSNNRACNQQIRGSAADFAKFRPKSRPPAKPVA
jgi:hypothetical protein